MTVNKIDRCFLELMLEPEEAYLSYRRVVENANVIMATYADDALGDTQVGGWMRGWCGWRVLGSVWAGLGLLQGAMQALAAHCVHQCPQLEGGSLHQTSAGGPPLPRQPCAAAPCPPLCPPQVYPEAGTVSFSAGLHGWAFTLTVFADLYAKKFGVERKKMMERLWGDNFFDPTTKKWTKKVGQGQEDVLGTASGRGGVGR